MTVGGEKPGRVWLILPGLAGFLLIALGFDPWPEDPRPLGWMAGVLFLMAWLWFSGVVPMAVTALLPLVCFPLFGIAGEAETARHYAHPILFLFLGGFLLAQAIEKCGLHRRIAGAILLLFGGSPRMLVLGFMLVCAGLSAWISNTATTVAMLPVALAVINGLRERVDEAEVNRFAPGLLLALAYSCSVGGILTPVGTPTNLVMLGQMETLMGVPPPGFLEWAVLTMPIAAMMILAVWLVLAWWLFPPPAGLSPDREVLRKELRELGPMSRGEWVVGVVFSVTALLWVTRTGFTFETFRIPGWSALLPKGISIGDGSVAILMAFLLFCLPVGERKGPGDRRPRALEAHDLMKVRWDVFLLLGGGFALGAGLVQSGLSEYLGVRLSHSLTELSPVVGLFLTAGFMTFLTEFTSNVASTSIMLPVVISSVPEGWDLFPFAVVTTVSASMAFMMPVATPPNAIILATPYVRIAHMVRAGIVLNLVGIVVVGGVLAVGGRL